MRDVTLILAAVENGDPAAAEQLLPVVYAELRKLAAAKLALENPGHTLQATALVHEAFLRLVKPTDEPTDGNERSWDGRGHFFAAAAEAMRRILVDNARRKRRLKHGGGLQQIELPDVPVVAPQIHEDLIALDAALDRLKGVDEQSFRIIHLRYFVGLTIPEAAEIMGIAPRTADRLWAFARAWLHREIAGAEEDLSEK